MVRKSQAEKAESRAKILDAAARLIREQGIEQASVAEVMEKAGLTHGGFYRHFDSKESLVTEAIGDAFRSGLQVFADDHPGTREEASAYIERYLSQDHLDDPGGGCPMPILAAESGRGPDPWRQAIASGLTQASTKLEEGLEVLSREEILALLSTLVGTMVLARGVGPGPLQDELRESSVRHVEALLAAHADRQT